MNDLAITSESREQTVSLGCFLGSRLPKGTIVCLDGDLGAGKTAFASGLAEGIDCLGFVSSPTFTLLIEHEPGAAGIALYHFDVYRLKDGAAFLDLGFDEYLSGEGICVIEWSSRIRSVLPHGCLMISLSMSAPECPDKRLIRLNWPDHGEWLREIEQWWKENYPC